MVSSIQKLNFLNFVITFRVHAATVSDNPDSLPLDLPQMRPNGLYKVGSEAQLGIFGPTIKVNNDLEFGSGLYLAFEYAKNAGFIQGGNNYFSKKTRFLFSILP